MAIDTGSGFAHPRATKYNGTMADDLKTVLIEALENQRRHVLAAVDGLTDQQLARPVLPSGWTCAGMLKHLALADEHYWFRSIIGGQSLEGYFPSEPGGDWKLMGDESPQSIRVLYEAEVAESDRILRTVDLADAPAQRDPRWDEWGTDYPTVNSVLVHMIVETACHAGHLDATRELLDGAQWLVL